MQQSQKDRRKEPDQKPFIKLFRSPRGYYFFDTNRDAVCSVDVCTYTELEQIMKGGPSSPVSETIAQLQDEGWLSTHRPSEIRSEMTDFAEYRLEHYVNQLNLQITQACNLSCTYCPYANNTDPSLSRHHTDKTMTFETAKKAIDFLVAKSDALDRVSVGFYGGEPLVAFPLVRRCVEYAEEVLDGKELSFFITTNATLMSDEVIDFLVEHRFYITFSLDGPRNVHDHHRLRADGSPTYDLVMETLEKTVARYGDALGARVLVNMVMNPDDPFDEILNWLDTPVMKKVLLQAGIAEDDYLEKKFTMSQDFSKKMIYQEAMSWLDYLGLVDGLKTNEITNSIVSRAVSDSIKTMGRDGALPDVACPGGPCLSGHRKLFVNTEGFFFPCEKVNELSPCMCIGDVDHGLDLEQVKRQINIGQLTAETCRNCWAIIHCNICQRQADGEDKLSGETKNRSCEDARQSFMYKLKAGTMMRELKTIYPAPKGEMIGK